MAASGYRNADGEEDLVAVDRSYVDANRASLDRLKAFVEKASDADLEHPMNDGWTVATVLAHVAFWDLRIVACAEAWRADGSGPVPTYHDDAEQRGSLNGFVAVVVRQVVERAPVQWLIDGGQGIAGLFD